MKEAARKRAEQTVETFGQNYSPVERQKVLNSIYSREMARVRMAVAEELRSTVEPGMYEAIRQAKSPEEQRAAVDAAELEMSELMRDV